MLRNDWGTWAEALGVLVLSLIFGLSIVKLMAAPIPPDPQTIEQRQSRALESLRRSGLLAAGRVQSPALRTNTVLAPESRPR